VHAIKVADGERAGLALRVRGKIAKNLHGDEKRSTQHDRS
jgi:hypothetical protein